MEESKTTDNVPMEDIVTKAKSENSGGVDNPAFDKSESDIAKSDKISETDLAHKYGVQETSVIVDKTTDSSTPAPPTFPGGESVDVAIEAYSRESPPLPHPLSAASVTVDGFAAGLDGHSLKAISVDRLSYDVKEKKAEWWERLANFQMPWEWARDLPKKRKKILNDVTFKVQSGEMLAVLGSSGEKIR